jgi:hypothetical protein
MTEEAEYLGTYPIALDEVARIVAEFCHSKGYTKSWQDMTDGERFDFTDMIATLQSGPTVFPETIINDCPPNIIEVRRNPDGSLDEIVANDCMVHLEQMDEGHWWMGIYKNNYRQVVNFSAVRADLNVAHSEMDDWPPDIPAEIAMLEALPEPLSGPDEADWSTAERGRFYRPARPWEVSLHNGPRFILETQAAAIETQQIAEYQFGHMATIHRLNDDPDPLSLVKVHAVVDAYSGLDIPSRFKDEGAYFKIGWGDHRAGRPCPTLMLQARRGWMERDTMIRRIENGIQDR